MISGDSLVTIKSNDSTENRIMKISDLFNTYVTEFPENYHIESSQDIYYESIDVSGNNEKIREWCTFTDIIEIGRTLRKEWVYIASVNKGIAVEINTLFPVYDKYYLPMTKYEYPIKIPFVCKSPMLFDDASALRLYDAYINDSGLKKDLVEFGEPIVQKYVKPKLLYAYWLKTKSNMFLANGFQIILPLIVGKEINRRK